LLRLSELLFQFLTEQLGLDSREVANAMWRVWQRPARTEKPNFLRDFIADSPLKPMRLRSTAPKRQTRHLAQS